MISFVKGKTEISLDHPERRPLAAFISLAVPSDLFFLSLGPHSIIRPDIYLLPHGSIWAYIAGMVSITAPED
jgi:hypothetical protein